MSFRILLQDTVTFLFLFPIKESIHYIVNMSVLNSWNGGTISNGKIIKINIDGKQYDLVVKDDRAYKDGTTL